MKKQCVFVLLVLMGMLTLVAQAEPTQPACSDFPWFEPKTGPLSVVNCDFHHAYEKHVADIVHSFGAPGGRPVILNLGGVLLFKYNGKTESVVITPASYHDAKVFSHAAFTVYLILLQTSDGKLDEAAILALQGLKNDLLQAQKIIPNLHISTEERKNYNNLATSTVQFIEMVLKNGKWTNMQLTAYYAGIKPFIDKSIMLAAKTELNRLNQTVNQWLGKLNKQERKELGIVVATAHQARSDEISLLYFSKKFHKKRGEGALNENGMIVLEGLFDEQAALTLLARHYLDRQAATVIFNHPDQLQRDLLSDAAKTILGKMEN